MNNDKLREAKKKLSRYTNDRKAASQIVDLIVEGTIEKYKKMEREWQKEAQKYTYGND